MKFDLDTPLLQLSANDVFRTRAACEGISAMGGVGSGKSSGLAKALAHAYLRAGFGGIVLTAKYDEIALWQKYARETGRSSSLVLFDESRGFNFLNHALAMHGVAGVGSIVEILMSVLEASDHATGSGVEGGRSVLGAINAHALAICRAVALFGLRRDQASARSSRSSRRPQRCARGPVCGPHLCRV